MFSSSVQDVASSFALVICCCIYIYIYIVAPQSFQVYLLDPEGSCIAPSRSRCSDEVLASVAPLVVQVTVSIASDAYSTPVTVSVVYCGVC